MQLHPIDVGAPRKPLSEEALKIKAKMEADIQFERTHVRLINCGWCPTIPAGEVTVGMQRAYNYGSFATITKIESIKGWLHITTHERGQEHTRKHRPDTRIPIITKRDGNPVIKETP